MTFDELMQGPGEWFSSQGPESDIVISSRVRLARNLRGHIFSSRNDEAEKKDIVAEITDALASSNLGKELKYHDVSGMSALDRHFLVERHLISREQEESGGARGVAINDAESIAVMINEEDHLRLQSMGSGLQLKNTYDIISRLDDELSETLDIAFDEELGYLTACPTNVGTGMRVSAMLHLPALVMTGHMEKALRAIHDLRMAVRGLYGEGTEAHGELYQISNQITTGRSEEEIIDDLQATIESLIEYEKKARVHLLEEKHQRVEDRIWRAVATLQNARIMSSDEAMQHLSSARLGATLGMLPGIDAAKLNVIFVHIQPAHLQRAAGRQLESEERDIARAAFIREQLKSN